MTTPAPAQDPLATPADPQRRAWLTAGAAGMALAGMRSAAAADAVAPAAALAPAFQSPAALRPLRFDPARLDGISERVIRSHWENNYGGSVKALAAVKKRLSEAMTTPDLPAFVYNDLKREHLLRTGSVVLHEYYFDNLGGNGKAGARERSALAASFGSHDAWESEFRRIAAGLGGGSGWVVLGYNTHLRQFENYWLADHAHGPAATLPVLVLDMYEHSYQMDYGAAAARYIDAFFRNVQWEVVAARMEAVQRG